MRFKSYVNKLIQIEGGYSNDSEDSGGETNFGITVAVARAHGYKGDMIDMTRPEAEAIYRVLLWDSLMLDQVWELSPALVDELFDSGANLGVHRTGTWLQRALNVLNQNGAQYPDIKVDGRVGPMTVATLREYLERRPAKGVTVMLRALNSLQGAFYIELAERRQKDEKFVFGWFDHRIT